MQTAERRREYRRTSAVYQQQAVLNRQRRYQQNRLTYERARMVPCVDCGLYEPEIMDLDHTGSDKVYNVSRMCASSRSRFLTELAKCETVCPNCHRRRTNARKAA